MCTINGIECRQWTSANANIFTEHIDFYPMVSLEFGGAQAHPAPMGTTTLCVHVYNLE